MEGQEFQLSFEEQPSEQIELFAYVFTRSGELIDRLPVKEGRFRLNLPRRARLLIGPALGDNAKPSLRSLERAGAYEPVLPMVGRPQELIELAPIPALLSKLWLWCRCRVRGRVVRPVTINDVTTNRPVCYARVHICEVDALPLIIERLPDPDLFRLRDELLEIIRWPIPMPDPPPFRFDPTVLDLTPANLAHLNRAAIPTPQEPFPVAFEMRAAPSHAHQHEAPELQLNPQPEPPGLQAASAARELELPLAARLALNTNTAPALRQALLANLALIRPVLCHLHWLHRWLRCDEVAVRYTDANGRFDATIFYPCAGDRPDLYFWVEYSIGGEWTTVYRPSMRCNTYWNYSCGSEVTISISDPRVPWCNDPSPLSGMQLAVISIGHAVGVTEVQGAAAGAAQGLTSAGEPFGGSLEPHVFFGDGLIAAGITHYRWSYRRFNPALGVDAPGWTALDRQVVRHYAQAGSGVGSPLTFKAFPLGPDPIFPSQTLFQIQREDPPAGSWEPAIDARENTASGFFLTHLLEGGDAAAAAGKYELKLELFRADGTRVSLTNADTTVVQVLEAKGDAPFGPVDVPTREAPSERLFTDGSGNVVAYRIVLHVDNTPCSGQIFPVSGSGLDIDADCGFYEYSPGATVTVRFRAQHPNGFATFNLTTVRGLSNLVEAASVPTTPVSVLAVNGFTRAGSVFTKALIPVAGGEGSSMLEGICDRAAFALTLQVFALATDGWSRLSYLNATPSVISMALVPDA